MAIETGKVDTVSSPTEGTIQRLPVTVTPNPVKYNDPTLVPRKLELKPGDQVVYDIDVNYNITNINLDGTDPDYPNNNDYPKATIINTPQAGDLTINGTITIIDGTTLTGNVKVTNGGTIIVKSTSPTSTIQGAITGFIHASENTTVIIYNSSVGSNIAVAGAAEFRVIKGGVKGNTEVARTKGVVVKGTTVKGNTEIQRSQSVVIKGTTVKGNVEIHENLVSTSLTDVTSTGGNIEIQGNAGCSYSNLTAPSGNVNVSGCTLIK